MSDDKKQYLTDENGNRTAIVLSIEEYEQLLEDLEDLALIAESKKEPTSPLETVVARLHKKWQITE